MKISIIGLGWLGLPLARELDSRAHQVMGSTTSEEKSKSLAGEGVSNVVFKLAPHPTGSDFNRLFEADLVIINIPPRTRTMVETFHPEQVKYLKSLLQQAGVKKVIYTSSTSIYPDVNGEVTELTPIQRETTGHPAMYQAERILKEDRDYDLTIVRFGGLLGMDRIPGRYVSGKEGVMGDLPINYIHQEDAVNVLVHLIDQGCWNETFNGVSPLHPTKKEVYEKNARDFDFLPPKSYQQAGGANWKVVSSKKLLETGFNFRYKDPLLFLYTP